LVYFLKKRTIAACVHVAFDESSFPGVAETPMADDREASDISPQVVTDQLMQRPSSLTPAPPAARALPKTEASSVPLPAPRLTPSPPPLDPRPPQR
jgi:hypothetical protein